MKSLLSCFIPCASPTPTVEPFFAWTNEFNIFISSLNSKFEHGDINMSLILITALVSLVSVNPYLDTVERWENDEGHMKMKAGYRINIFHFVLCLLLQLVVISICIVWTSVVFFHLYSSYSLVPFSFFVLYSPVIVSLLCCGLFFLLILYKVCQPLSCTQCFQKETLSNSQKQNEASLL